MDNMIASILSSLVFIAFVAGLAISIHQWPFTIIVIGVITMLLVDVVQSIIAGFKNNNKH